ncbi:MAG: glycosyltransferase [Synechococcus sp.]
MAIAPTQFLANAYRLNGFTMPTTVQWFGVDIDRTPKPVRSPDTPLRIGYIGQLAAHKGVDLLVEAFQSLQPCNAELLIYGSVNQDVTYSRHLKKLAQEKVSFLGTFEPTDMGRIMNELDILIIPSRWYENSPLVLLYALATHTPVIVSRVDGLTEFLDEGVNGYSFERGSIPELSKVLQRFIIDPSLASRLSRSTSYDRTTEDMATDLSKQLEVALRSK